jgi:hypothetical protein
MCLAKCNQNRPTRIRSGHAVAAPWNGGLKFNLKRVTLFAYEQSCSSEYFKAWRSWLCLYIMLFYPVGVFTQVTALHLNCATKRQICNLILWGRWEKTKRRFERNKGMEGERWMKIRKKLFSAEWKRPFWLIFLNFERRCNFVCTFVIQSYSIC